MKWWCVYSEKAFICGNMVCSIEFYHLRVIKFVNGLESDVSKDQICKPTIKSIMCIYKRRHKL